MRQTGPGRHPFVGRDVAWLVDQQARARGEHPAIVWAPFDGPAEPISYRALAQRSQKVAAAMYGKGVRAGDRVLLHLDNRPEFIVSWLACARVGAVCVTTNTRLATDELAYCMAHADVSGAIFADAEISNVVRADASAGNRLRWVAVCDDGSGSDGFEVFERGGDPAGLPDRPVDPMAPMGIQYTSGTTARPKGVVLSHANALWGARTSASHEDLRSSDVHLANLPLFHINALCYSMLASLWVGATLVLQPRFSASRFWPVVERHRCTWTTLTRFSWRALQHTDPPAEHTLRLVGNAWCEPPTDARWGVKTIGWWGMTETVTHGIVGDVHHPNRSMSMGRPAPEYGISVRDDDGAEVGPDDTGELHVRGVRGISLFAEYLHDPEATAAAFTDDGWMRTGDLVTAHADGFLSFADRAKDMLRVGGENVAASEIERIIAAVPGVEEVAVVGRPHTMLDEQPVAFVIASGAAGSSDLVNAIGAACGEQLADFKRPRAVWLVDELPRSLLGKVAKNQLRAQALTHSADEHPRPGEPTHD